MPPTLLKVVRRQVLVGSITAFLVSTGAPLVPFLLSAAVASGANQTWINAGPTNNWNTAAPDLNWDAGVPWTQGNSAIFGGTGETITLSTAITAGGLTFNSTGFVISGNTLTLTGTPTITVTNSSDSATISSTISDSVGLGKAGAGQLNLSADNSASLTGTLTISTGSIRLDGATGFSAVALGGNKLGLNSANALASGATVTLNGTGALVIGDNQTANVALTNTTGRGNLVVGNNAVLNGTIVSNFSTGTTFNAGTTATVNSQITVQTSAFTFREDASANAYAALGASTAGAAASTTTFNGKITGAGAFDVGVSTGGAVKAILTNTANDIATMATIGTGTIAFNTGTLASVGAVSMSGGVLQWNGTNTDDVSSEIVMVNAQTAKFDTNGNIVNFANAIGSSTTGALQKLGAGTLILSGTNTYLGTTTVTTGTLKAGSAGAFGINSAVTLANTAGVTLDLNGQNVAIGSLATGGTTGGNVTLGSGTLTTGGNNTSTSYAGAISGNGGLIKIGTGTQTLSGANLYTGATAVNGGTLNLTGSLTSAVTIGNGAILTRNAAGTGSTTGNITFNNGAGILLNTAGAVQGANITVDATTNVFVNAAPTGSLVTQDVIRYTGTTPGTANFSAAINYRSGAYADTGSKITLAYKAEAKTWVDADGTWQVGGTGAAWTGGSDSNFDWGDSATFGAIAADRTVTLSGNLAPSSITVSNAANKYTFSGSGSIIGVSTLTKTGAGTLSIAANVSVASVTMQGSGTVNSGTITVTTGGNLNVAGALIVAKQTGSGTATARFTQDDGTVSANTLTIATVATANGGYTLSGGTLNVSGSTVVADQSPATGFFIVSGGTANLYGVNLNTSTSNVSSTFQVDGGRVNIGSGGLSASGGTAGNGGTKRFGEATIGAFGDWASTIAAITLSGTTNGTTFDTLDSVDGVTAHTITIASTLSGTNGKLSKIDAGTLLLTATNSYTGGTTISGGTLAFDSGSLGTTGSVKMDGGALRWDGTNTQDISSRLVMENGKTATFDTNGNNVTFATAIGSSTTGALIKFGAGTLTFSSASANTYTGVTTITNGTLVLSGGNDRLATGGSVTLGDTSTSGKLVLGNTTAASNQTLAGLTNTGLGGSVVGANATTNSVLTVNNAAGTDTFDGVLGGAGTNENNLALTKNGVGTLVLTGTNTFVGPTTVSQGTLVVSGSISGSVTSVASVATFASGNNLTSAVNSLSVLSDSVGAGNGGSLLVGGTTTSGTNGIGKLNIGGALNLGTASTTGTAHLAMELGGTTAGSTYDQVAVTAAAGVSLNNVQLDLSLINGFGAIISDDTKAGLFNGDTFFIVVGANAHSGTFANDFGPDALSDGYGTIFAAGGQEFAVNYSAIFGSGFNSTGGNDIALMAIPEPGSAPSLLGGLGCLLGLQRFRRRRSR